MRGLSLASTARSQGQAQPRLAPPSARPQSDLAEFRATARECGLRPVPLAVNRRPLPHRARQEGPVAVRRGRHHRRPAEREDADAGPPLVGRLVAGRRIMHTAQNRELPREVHGLVADIMETNRPRSPALDRFANGQEEIRLTNGGLYRIVAPTRGGARGRRTTTSSSTSCARSIPTTSSPPRSRPSPPARTRRCSTCPTPAPRTASS